MKRALAIAMMMLGTIACADTETGERTGSGQSQLQGHDGNSTTPADHGTATDPSAATVHDDTATQDTTATHDTTSTVDPLPTHDSTPIPDPTSTHDSTPAPSSDPAHQDPPAGHTGH
jgi:hypothetical protein